MNARNDTSRVEQLSAYLDGELSASETRIIDEQLKIDSALRTEFEKLMDADLIAKSQLEAMLNEPVPLSIAQSIKNTPLEAKTEHAVKTNAGFGRLQAIAASIALLSIGVVGGYFIKDYVSPTSIVVADISTEQSWINEIASYHAVYAKQKRHLVEVKASGTSDASSNSHIKKWLSKNLDHNFNIPDLTAGGLTFEGARLLVVSGKPVAQLMYTSADGEVVALCIQKHAQSQSMNAKMPAPINDTINGFDFFYWEHGGADLVLIGNQGFGDFKPLAKSTNNQI